MVSSLDVILNIAEHEPLYFVPGDVQRALDELARLQRIEAERDKLILDTGGGCAICGHTPVFHLEGSYWLCGECILEDRMRANRIEAAAREWYEERKKWTSTTFENEKPYMSSLTAAEGKLVAALEE